MVVPDAVVDAKVSSDQNLQCSIGSNTGLGNMLATVFDISCLAAVDA